MEELNIEEFRNQFAVLKEQLKKQEIVSEHLLRVSMKSTSSSISYTKKVSYGAAFICLILYPALYLTRVWSLPFTIVTCLIMLLCVVGTYYIHRPVENLHFMRDDLATVARVMARFKKQYDWWLHYVTPALMIPWCAWACYEYAWIYAPEGVSPWKLCLPLLVGAVVGALVGYRYHRKAVNAAQNIIDEIESLDS